MSGELLGFVASVDAVIQHIRYVHSNTIQYSTAESYSRIQGLNTGHNWLGTCRCVRWAEEASRCTTPPPHSRRCIRSPTRRPTPSPPPDTRTPPAVPPPSTPRWVTTNTCLPLLRGWHQHGTADLSLLLMPEIPWSVFYTASLLDHKDLWLLLHIRRLVN